MKYLNRNAAISFAVWIILSAWAVYAAQSITSLSQTASTGDKVTSTWVNAVNTKLSTVDASAGSTYFGCYVVVANTNSYSPTYGSCVSGYTKTYSASVTYNGGSFSTAYETGYPPASSAMYSLGGTLIVSIKAATANVNYPSVAINGSDIYPTLNSAWCNTSSMYCSVALCCK